MSCGKRRPTFHDFTRFIRKMKETGDFTWDVLEDRASRNVNEIKQFVIACLVTRREILQFDDTVLEDFEHYLQRLPRINFNDGYLLHERVVFLINKTENDYNKHGEARLLDPEGHIRDYLCIDRPCDEFEEPLDYLSEMTDEFLDEFGEEAKPYLLIFSHYIPCLMPEQSCADVLGEFAYNNHYRIFVGYEDVYEEEDGYDALQIMKNAGIRTVSLA